MYDRYGGTDRLRVEEVPTPRPRTGQVLVQIVATAVNLSDWEALRGSPAYARMGGLTRPRRHVLGSDIAGLVVAVGPDVRDLTPGDEVYGDNLGLLGGFAEYAVAPATALVRKPAALTFVQAATLPQPGSIAVQAVARAPAGSRVLVNGGGGGTGMFAIQLAIANGAQVCGVDSASKLDFMRGLGATEVIDYREQDFTRAGRWDLILDVVASRSVSDYRRALEPGGTCLVVGGRMRSVLGVLVHGAAISAVSDHRLGILAVKQGPRWFEPLGRRVVAGEVRVHVDRMFPLEETAQALDLVGAGQAVGKVVVRVADDPA